MGLIYHLRAISTYGILCYRLTLDAPERDRRPAELTLEQEAVDTKRCP